MAPRRRSPEDGKYFAVIGRRIQALRHAANLSQEDVASKIGYTRITVHHVETGKQDISVYFLYKVAECLGCSVHALLPENIEEELEKENVYHLAQLLNVDAEINQQDLADILSKIRSLKPKEEADDKAKED